LFQALDLHWSSPESGDVWYTSKQLKMTIWSREDLGGGLVRGGVRDQREATPAPGLVFEAHTLLYHSTLGLRVITKRRRRRNLHHPSPNPQSVIKSSFSIALIWATSRRIPASASTNKGTEKGDLILLWGLVDPPHQRADMWRFRSKWEKLNLRRLVYLVIYDSG